LGLIASHVNSTSVTDGWLTQLLLGSTTVTDAGVRHLVTLPNLRQVSFAGPELTDDGLKYLSTLSNLSNVGVGGPMITDAGLKYLSALPNLTHLLVVQAPMVTDAGVLVRRESQYRALGWRALGVGEVAGPPVGPSRLVGIYRIDANPEGKEGRPARVAA
jgi:hypothetical protein